MPEAIDKQRQNSIRAMIEGLHNLLTELRDGQKGCSFACGSMLLGSLMKSMHSNNLLSDLSLRPQIPFSGLSFEGTAAGIRLMQSPPWDECLSDHGSSVGSAFGTGVGSAFGASAGSAFGAGAGSAFGTGVGGAFGTSSAFGNSNASRGSSPFGGFGGGGGFRDVGVPGSNNYGSRLHVCTLEDLIKPILDHVGLTMTGLKLELFSGSA